MTYRWDSQQEAGGGALLELDDGDPSANTVGPAFSDKYRRFRRGRFIHVCQK